LLADEDLAWLRSTFVPEQLTVFPQSGHLGNLFHPAVQKSILGAHQHEAGPTQRRLRL